MQEETAGWSILSARALSGIPVGPHDLGDSHADIDELRARGVKNDYLTYMHTRSEVSHLRGQVTQLQKRLKLIEHYST